MTEVSAGTLTDFLLARIADAERQLHPADCDCLVEGMPFEHGARCPVLLLAECEAKRRIVREWLKHDGPTRSDLVAGARWALDMAVTWLALPYADHAEFNPAWRL